LYIKVPVVYEIYKYRCTCLLQNSTEHRKLYIATLVTSIILYFPQCSK